MENAKDKLLSIGFNNLEAEVYIYLLSHLPATAYKIGKQITKPTANVYKAIDSLAKKGAVLLEDNKNKLCKAVNPTDFINQYEKSILEKTQKANEELSMLNNETEDQKSYTIESVSLVFEKFSTMMLKCKSIAVIDAFPKVLEKIKPIIEKTTARGIDVYVEAYKPIEIEGANVVCATVGKQTLEYWKSQQLNIVIDGDEYLVVLLDDNLEIVKQAVWSSNTYMSCVLHAGRLHEQTVMKIMEAVENPNFEQFVKEILNRQKFFFNSNIPGFYKLFKNKL